MVEFHSTCAHLKKAHFLERQRTYSSIKHAGRSSLRNLITSILLLHQDDSDTGIADSMFLEARKVRANPPGLAPLESPIPLQHSKSNRIRQQRGTLDFLDLCGPLRSQASLLNERKSTIFTFKSSYDDHAPQRGGSKEQPLRTARVPRFGAGF